MVKKFIKYYRSVKTLINNTTFPKLSFCYIVYNESDYLKQSIDSIYDDAHEIFFSYGAIENRHLVENDEKTLEIIKNYPDPGKKIKKIFIQNEWASNVQMRNAPLKYLTGDYYFIIDGDEVYLENSIKIIKKEIIKYPQVMLFLIPCLVFWGDFKTVIGRKFNFDRIFKISESCKIVPSGNKMVNRYGIDYKYLSYINLGLKYSHLFNHYSYVRNDEYIKDKMSFYSNRTDNNGLTKGIKNYYENIWLKSKYDMKSVIEKYGGFHPVHPWQFNKLYNYTGEHPSVMKNHPFWSFDYQSGLNIEIDEWRPKIKRKLTIQKKIITIKVVKQTIYFNMLKLFNKL